MSGLWAWLTRQQADARYQALGAPAPANELGYAATTANQTGIGTSATDLTNLSVTVTVGSNPIIIIAKVVFQQQTSAATYTEVDIMEGATRHQVSLQAAYAAGAYVTHFFSVRLAPSAGSHTYKLQGFTQANTVNLAAASDFPSFIQVLEVA